MEVQNLLSNLNEVAHLANVVLIPCVWILYKIEKRITKLALWAEFHEKEDNRIQAELAVRVRELELQK